MRLYDITCSACGSVYGVAESETAVGSPGVQNCSECGVVLASRSDRKLKAFKLEISPWHFVVAKSRRASVKFRRASSPIAARRGDHARYRLAP